MDKKVRIGVVGTGGMAFSHMANIAKIEAAEVTAVCDVDEKRAEEASGKFGGKAFIDHVKLLDSGLCDAVLIATPHYFHPSIAIDAFKRKIHVLSEKPTGVYTQHIEEMNKAAAESGCKFAAMFQLRTQPIWKKVKELIESGELGELIRVNWIITAWFRTQAYYDSGAWRATWKGEGGGVLLNQCPHNLDLFQWFFGMPTEMTAHCDLGGRHRIEVEDQVTAFMRFKNGATGVFIASTCETPGTDRLEITGERGKLVVEGGQLVFHRTRKTVREVIDTGAKWGGAEVWRCEIPVRGRAGNHAEILKNFVDAILNDKPLIAPGEEGIRSVELANAMILSGVDKRTVTLPINGAAYKAKLDELIKEAEKSK